MNVKFVGVHGTPWEMGLVQIWLLPKSSSSKEKSGTLRVVLVTLLFNLCSVFLMLDITPQHHSKAASPHPHSVLCS